MPRLLESDVPKVVPREIHRFLALPGSKPVDLVLKEVVWDRGLVSFFMVNRTPFPFFSSVSARLLSAQGREVWTDTQVEFIGPFATDEWQLVDIPVGTTSLSLRLGIFPFEIALAELTV